MSYSWYYVEGKDRVGPVSQAELADLFKQNKLKLNSYIWRNGFTDWKKARDVEEICELFIEVEGDTSPKKVSQIPETIIDRQFSWDTVEKDHKIFSIKIGKDRGHPDTEYGPFSLEELKKLFDQKRINEKTYIFSPGMENWVFLGDIDIYDTFFSNVPPIINEEDRRGNLRRPFVARMFFHDTKKVYEGICRDISIGGLQVLVSDFPVHVQETIAINVHPENTDYHFVADGEIVRILDGNQGFALRFKDLGNEATSAIKKYLSNT
ncbi:MAG: DUF4339 domain-containing protein [Halobacteriovoraceae bacterium]|nr:DUF4339 domain-containing protein [Halobacteriovoraceae bacterium]